MANSWIDEMIDQITNMTRNTNIDSSSLVNSIRSLYESGDYLGLQGIFSGRGFNLTPEQEKNLDNLIAAQNTQSARDFEVSNSEQDILRAGKQLESLGLSPSGVLQTGGSGTNGVSAADNVKSNVAMNKYNQRMAVAKQLLSMTSSMASAGIYGKALGAAKKASSVVTSAASHSAYRAMSGRVNQAHWNQMVNDLENTGSVDDGSGLPF